MVFFFLFVASHLFLNSFGQNANVTFEKECYNVGDTLKITAEYTGSGDPSLVQWYFSGVPAERFKLEADNCQILGFIPDGFPDDKRLTYLCSLSDNTYTLEVTELRAAEVNASWGATFNPPTGAIPAPVQEPIVECKTTTTSDCGLIVFHNCNLSKGVGVFLWCFTSICLVALVTVVVILILRFVIGVKFPCRILNCENKRTSPKGSKSEKKSTEGKHQGTQDEENKILALQDTNYTKKRPPAKLDQLDEPGSKKHHIGGRPLPEIGKYN